MRAGLDAETVARLTQWETRMMDVSDLFNLLRIWIEWFVSRCCDLIN